MPAKSTSYSSVLRGVAHPTSPPLPILYLTRLICLTPYLTLILIPSLPNPTTRSHPSSPSTARTSSTCRGESRAMWRITSRGTWRWTRSRGCSLQRLLLQQMELWLRLQIKWRNPKERGNGITENQHLELTRKEKGRRWSKWRRNGWGRS